MSGGVTMIGGWRSGDKLYQNVTEAIVEEMYLEVKDKLGVCECEECAADILAFALNQLPPRYVVSDVGAAAMKVQSLTFQNDADVKSAIYKGADLIRKHPRHEV